MSVTRGVEGGGMLGGFVLDLQQETHLPILDLRDKRQPLLLTEFVQVGHRELKSALVLCDPWKASSG